MSEEDNLKEPEKKDLSENVFKKGWNNFVDGIKGGFDKFQKSLEEQSEKNIQRIRPPCPFNCHDR